MKKLMAIMAVGTLVAAQGCSTQETDDTSVASVEQAVTTGAVLTAGSTWATGYCGNVKLTNGSGKATAGWKVVINLNGATWANNGWNGYFTVANGKVSVSNTSYNMVIAKDWVAEFGFCVNRTSTSQVPTIASAEVTPQPDCSVTAAGTYPTKAALVIAMANELGRVDPFEDLIKTGTTLSGQTSAVALNPNSSQVKTKCGTPISGCKNVRNILDLQSDIYNNSFPGFNATNFREDLKASFDRQANAGFIANTMTKVGGPTNYGAGACGAHFVYTPKTPAGVLIPVDTFKTNLVFFGGTANPFLMPIAVDGNIAIDPGGDVDGSGQSGTCAAYTNDRLYDPAGTYVGTCCIDVNKVMRKMARLSATSAWDKCNGDLL